MKKFLIPLLVLGASVLSVTAKDYRTYTNKDGKIITASFVQHFDKQGKRLVELEMEETGKRYKLDIQTLSQSDQDYLGKRIKIVDAARRLAVTITPKEVKGKHKLTGGRRVSSTDSAFEINFRNNGKADLDGITAEYRMIYKKEKRVWETKGVRRIGKSKSQDAYKKGELKLAALASRKDHTLKSVSVALNNDRPNKGGPG